MNKIKNLTKKSLTTLLFSTLAFTVSNVYASNVVVLNNNPDLFDSQSSMREQARIHQQDMDG